MTHSFGRRLGEDGLESENITNLRLLSVAVDKLTNHIVMAALWMHFLTGRPGSDPPDRQPEWVKWGFVLTWLPKTALTQTTNPPSGPVATYTVTMIVFQPPGEIFKDIVRFVNSSSWADATVDPYILVDITLVSWYRLVDKIAWEATKLILADEKDIFRRAQMLRSTSESTVTDLDLHRIHTNTKNAVFMIEALDAAIRLVGAVLSDHEMYGQRGNRVWENTHRRLRHRSELFHSTRLRTVSSQGRIKNTVDLVRHQHPTSSFSDLS